MLQGAQGVQGGRNVSLFLTKRPEQCAEPAPTRGSGVGEYGGLRWAPVSVVGAV
jgi:hypothetical protein